MINDSIQLIAATVSILASFIGAVFFIINYVRRPKEIISIYQEGDEILLFSNFKSTIEVNMCSLSFNDILSRPKFSRKDSTPLLTNIQQPVKSHEGVIIFKISEKLIDLASEYIKFEKEAFHNEYPSYVYPYFIGITFYIDYSILGKTGVKRAKVKRIFLGSKEEGFYISKPAYGKDSYLPKRSKAKENILSFFKSPRSWLKNRYHMRLMQADLDFKGINNALIYGKITKRKALTEMKKVKKIKTSEEIEDFIIYLENNTD